jgi:hypothetical protein
VHLQRAYSSITVETFQKEYNQDSGLVSVEVVPYIICIVVVVFLRNGLLLSRDIESSLNSSLSTEIDFN